MSRYIPVVCSKIGYKSRQEARHVLKLHDRAKSGGGGKGGRIVYKCRVPGCGQWHLGRKFKQRRQ